jgi:3-oxoacyl-[acyl-carrier-protein] synthase-3
MHAAIRAIEYHLPENVSSAADLARQFPDWSVDRITAKIGIVNRHLAGSAECASDLAVRAAEKLFESGVCGPQEIDYVLLCTQSPDYFLPTTACLLQDRLGIPTSAGALDFNLGCSGYVYGLGLCEGLISSEQATRVLLLTAETYSKYLHPSDRGVRALFGDAAAATLVAAVDVDEALLGPFVYGSDGRGAPNLIVRSGGARCPRPPETAHGRGASDPVNPADCLYMDGPEIFKFTLDIVPKSVQRLLDKSAKSLGDIDLFVFHQANRHMLDHLRKRLGIPEEKFHVFMENCGNTVSSTIPIALKNAMDEGRLAAGCLVMLVGFGVGYSWGATLLRVTEDHRAKSTAFSNP